MEKGIITKKSDRGYSFIQSSTGEKIFVHIKNVDKDIYKRLKPGCNVLFESEIGNKGKFATRISLDLPSRVSDKIIDFSEEQIRGLFGDLAAEDENKERFSSYFIKTDVYEKVHNFMPIRILVAHKGIGKSAVFRMSYLENIENKILSIWVRPDDILKLAESNGEPDSLELINQWKAGLEKLLAEKIISDFNVNNDTEIIKQVSKKGLKFAEKIGIIVKNVSEIVNTDEIKKDIAKKYKENHKIVVYIDDLDRAWNGSKQNIYRISALLNAVRDLCNESNELCFRISLRSDVYYLVRTADESTDKIDGNVLWLKWTEHELLALLVKRVQSYFGNNIFEKDLLDMNQNDMAEYLNDIMDDTFKGSGKWNNRPIRYIFLSLIRRRPRDLINLCTLAARNANANGRNLIETEDWEEVFEQYSSSRLQDTINEHKYELPDIERLLLGMKPSHEMKKTEKPFVYSKDQLVRKICGITQNGKFFFANKKECSVDELIAFMYKINFLNARKNMPGGFIDRKYFEDNKYITSSTVDFGYDWEVHPAFRWALFPESRDIFLQTDIPQNL
ncbi:MAG: cold shock domain-containing protein [Clostridiales bacterium]|nr:cold shock domain-containing protein [Clostridiales bacterium]MCC8106998.1 cold shock domain-containing protein [Clostridiales bacterium]